ncbi:MAG: hypothetical protein KME31_29345 [Tolypothrix carrinoi HA7290-LM1]|nr:hypothetical protein [Tolypothrix carrinoi HA7290-LM1]
MGIIRNSADTLKKTTMELGGKSANIVFADSVWLWARVWQRGDGELYAHQIDLD